MESKANFQAVKRVNRMGMSLICGFYFHYMQMAFKMDVFNLLNFWILLITGYFFIA